VDPEHEEPDVGRLMRSATDARRRGTSIGTVLIALGTRKVESPQAAEAQVVGEKLHRKTVQARFARKTEKHGNGVRDVDGGMKEREHTQLLNTRPRLNLPHRPPQRLRLLKRR
jgi:hypothetical protein